MKRFMVVVMLLSLPVIVLGQWEVSILKSGSVTPFKFGTNALATDGFDADIDMPAPPAPPSGFDAYFPVVHPLFSRLMWDFRAIDDTINWRLIINWYGSMAESVTLSWNPALLPSAYGAVYIDTLSTMATAWNMASASFYTVKNYPKTLYIQFRSGETEDTEPPYAINWFPPCGSDDVPVDIESLSVDVIDAISGVNLSSFSVTVNSYPVTAFVLFTPIPGGYHLYFAPPFSLPYDSDVTIRVEADDNLGHHMVATCAFRTESAPGTGHRLSGYIYDAITLSPLADATVVDADFMYSGVSNSSGYYQINNVPDGVYIFNAAKVGYIVESDTIVFAGADITHDFYLRPAATYVTISGTVTNAETHNPIADAIVTATWPGGSASDNTNALGFYSISSVAGGTLVKLVARAGGYIPDSVINTFSGDATVNFELDPIVMTYTVSGYITLEGETNHSGTVVTLEGFAPVTTNAAGYFAFEDVPAGTRDFTATHSGFVTFDTTIVVSSDIFITRQLARHVTGLMPPRNTSATVDMYAWVTVISWEPPLEPGEVLLDHYTGDPYWMFFVTDSTQAAVFFESPGSDYRINRIRIATANRLSFTGHPAHATPTVQIAVVDTLFGEIETNVTDSYSEDWWQEAPFALTAVPDFFFVHVYNEIGADTVTELLASDASGSGDGEYCYWGSVGDWTQLSEVAGYEDIGFMIEVYMTNVYTGREIAIPPIYAVKPNGHIKARIGNRSDDFSAQRINNFRKDIPLVPEAMGLFRTMAPMELEGYRLYRSETPFASPSAPGVELIYETTPDTLFYADWDAEPEVDYYYGVTAVYPEGESPLSNVVLGRCLDMRDEATVLILDWDNGDSLAEGGTMDEALALRDLLMGIGIPASEIYVSEQDEFIQHFFPYTDYATYYGRRYDAIFWITGAYPADYFWGGANWDTIYYINYLLAGGNLYTEGVDIGWALDEEEACPTMARMMGFRYEADGSDMEDGNVVNLTATNRSFFSWGSNFTIDYYFQTIADHYTDELSPRTGAVELMRSQEDDPAPAVTPTRMIYFDAPSPDSFKTITSSVYLGSMINSTYPGTQMRILGSILWSFGIANTYAEEKPFMKPEAPAILGNTPNPFNATTLVKFKLPSPDHVKLEIVDETGHIVATIFNNFADAGIHSARWNGADFSGKEMPSGIYTCRLITSSGTITNRITLLK